MLNLSKRIRLFGSLLVMTLVLPALFQNCGRFEADLTFTSSKVGLPNPPIEPVINPWEEKFRYWANIEHKSYYNPWSLQANSYWHYYIAYGVDGHLAMFEATGKKEYLDQALYYLQQVKSTATPQDDGYLGWVATDPKTGNLMGEVSLYESFLWRYGARALNLIRKNPRLYNDPTYRSQYELLLDFVETHLFEKWYTRGPSHIYRSRTHMASHWASIALYLSEVTTSDERRAQYDQVISNFNTDLSIVGLKGGMRHQLHSHPKDPSTYFWSGVWGSTALPGNDVSHANAEIQFMIESYLRGNYWTKSDMFALRSLVKNVLWNQSMLDPAFAANLDGSGSSDNTFISDGVLKLGRFDPDLQKIFEAYEGQNLYRTQYYGNSALNAKILSEKTQPKSYRPY